MTDRDDGTVWWITYNTTTSPPADGLGRIAINDELPEDKGDRRVYGPYAGPYLGPIRLLIRGGRIGYEIIPRSHVLYGDSRSQHRIMARASNTSRDMREIIVPSTWEEFDDVLGWQEVQL